MNDRGSCAIPWVAFGADCDTGVYLENGVLMFSLDGIRVDRDAWLHGIEKKGHIDSTHRVLITLLSMTKRFG